jgi:predicted small lipoprotein YifL
MKWLFLISMVTIVLAGCGFKPQPLAKAGDIV